MSVVGGKADIMGLKADIKLLMSVFALFMSVVGGKADIKSIAANVRS